MDPHTVTFRVTGVQGRDVNNSCGSQAVWRPRWRRSNVQKRTGKPLFLLQPIQRSRQPKSLSLKKKTETHLSAATSYAATQTFMVTSLTLELCASSKIRFNDSFVVILCKEGG